MTESFTADPARLRGGWGVKWGSADPDVLPAWVADMDFPAPEVVRRRITEVVDRSDFGYPFWPGGDPVVLAFEERMRARYGWDPEPGRTRVFSDLLQILQVVIEHATRPGDGVAILVPSYPPFLASLDRAGRRIVPILVEDDGDSWVLRADGLVRRLREAGVRLLVLVNPHNPTGRVLTREELHVLGDAARELDLVVLSDEIHADLIHDGHRHLPFAALSADAAARTITATSATKAFNIAGLRCAVAHLGHAPTRTSIEQAPLDYFGAPSILSRVATVAAWCEGDPWLEQLRTVLAANRGIVTEWAADRPDLRFHPPQATYLAWIDFGATRLAGAPAEEILRLGRARLSEGAEFSQCTTVPISTYARLNFATDPDTLRELLTRIDRACLSTT